jgi:acetolactate synthase I/II/III large subunit
MIVADYFAGTLADQGVRHVFGVGGANIEDMFAAVQRRRPQLRAVLGKHEHAAATAADAYARLGGGLGVVMATSGGGAMNLVHGLAEARASRVPLLAIVGEPPSDVQGRGAFQDTSGRGGAIDAAQVFRAVSVFCARLEAPAAAPELLRAAIAAARGPIPGPAVVLIAKDRQRGELPDTAVDATPPPPVVAAPPIDDALLERAARLLDRDPVVVIAGDEVARAGATEELAELVRALDARVAVAPDARDAFDNNDPRFLGVAGAMGHDGVSRALAEAATCVLVGTRMPLLARLGIEAAVAGKARVCLAREPPFLSAADGVHAGGDLRANLRGLRAHLPARTAAVPPDAAPAAPAPAREPLSSPVVLAAIARAIPDGGVVLVDAGNTGAQAAHHLSLPRGGRWLLAMGMAGMGWSFGAAVGAALATGRRCTVVAGDGAFFMHGLDVHTAVEHALPITYVVFNNHAHGMCLVRERLLLGGESGYNTFRAAHIGAGLAAMFPGLPACDCATLDELERALARARGGDGPCVISVELPTVEVPPFVAFQHGGRR